MKLCKDPKELIDSELPIHVRMRLVNAIKKGYLNAENKKTEDWLNWKIGLELIPRIRRTEIEREIVNTIVTHDLPVKYRCAFNKSKNCRHLELLTKNCIVTISHVTAKHQIPKKAKFRSNLSYNNQLSLFNFENTFSDGPYYIILTHGYSGDSPQFISLGLPSPEVRGWIFKMDILNEGLTLIEKPENNYSTPEEVITGKPKLKLKTHLKGDVEYGNKR